MYTKLETYGNRKQVHGERGPDYKGTYIINVPDKYDRAVSLYKNVKGGYTIVDELTGYNAKFAENTEPIAIYERSLTYEYERNTPDKVNQRAFAAARESKINEIEVKRKAMQNETWTDAETGITLRLNETTENNLTKQKTLLGEAYNLNIITGGTSVTIRDYKFEPKQLEYNEYRPFIVRYGFACEQVYSTIAGLLYQVHGAETLESLNNIIIG